MRLSPCMALAASLLTAHAPLLAAQAIDSSAIGSRVRVASCAEPADGSSPERYGVLRSRDADALVLAGSDGHEVIPMSRVLRMEVNTKRSRELEGVGLLAGIVGGLFSLRFFFVGGGDTIGPEIALIPVAAVVGGVVGYLAGGRLSGEEEWASLPLPPGHGSACAR
jgi:hypothetical protein